MRYQVSKVFYLRFPPLVVQNLCFSKLLKTLGNFFERFSALYQFCTKEALHSLIHGLFIGPIVREQIPV